ncbi:hypothetical protein BHE97_17455 [Aeromicrobium sp. PE09-221]|uniref:glycosyltransferase family 2 protein n=1 Tax=Aeromicrobium sp. PE09-221 TaxID=1898043 RepID=UPI000B3ED83A|nr:glycosyltransferase family 2 protein [Aeromicrobium sp. PE09-221]OUZ07287.1 hypothetical protein BHE97_17455 [Aeromicrobium sp. PE09-221]
MSDRLTQVGGTGVALTVVIPTHNVEPWVQETLDSVLGQDVDDMEVIVVDDHSTDRTRQIVSDYSARDARLTLLQTDGRGGGTARNLGVENARGKYLIFCDGDDLIPDGAYAALVASLEASGSDIAFGDYLKFRPAHTWRPTRSMEAFSRPQTAIRFTDEPTLLYSRPCWNKAFVREWWEENQIRFPDVPRSNDIVPMVTAYLAARRIDIVDDVVYLYRERPGGSSMTAQATSTTSMLSYLGQELECARMLSAHGGDDLGDVYKRLIYDRDTYVHIARFLNDWTEPSDDDQVIANAIAELLKFAPPPSPLIAMSKRVTVQLAALGEMSAAKTFASGAGRWSHALGCAARHGLILDEDREAVTDRVTAVLASADLREDPAERLLLVDVVRRHFSDSFLRYVPETRLPGTEDQAFRSADRIDATVTTMAGGVKTLALAGHHSGHANEAVPVLINVDADPRTVVTAAQLELRPSDDGGCDWRATFSVRSVPLHHSLVPALQFTDGTTVLAAGETRLPEYAAKDSFLYRRIGRVVLTRRRRHWAPRAVKRSLIILRDRLRRGVGRGPDA